MLGWSAIPIQMDEGINVGITSPAIIPLVGLSVVVWVRLKAW